MKVAINNKGDIIKDKNEKIIYRIVNKNVFAPNYYSDKILEHFNRGQFIEIGKFDGRQCSIDNEIIFKIKEI